MSSLTVIFFIALVIFKEFMIYIKKRKKAKRNQSDVNKQKAQKNGDNKYFTVILYEQSLNFQNKNNILP